MNTMKKILILILNLLLCSNLYSQENNEKIEAGNSSQPLELPNFIIEGKVQLDIKSGSKDFPDKPLPLGQNQLDSMNTLEKQQLILLPSEPLPDKILNKEFNNI